MDHQNTVNIDGHCIVHTLDRKPERHILCLLPDGIGHTLAHIYCLNILFISLVRQKVSIGIHKRDRKKITYRGRVTLPLPCRRVTPLPSFFIYIIIAAIHISFDTIFSVGVRILFILVKFTHARICMYNNDKMKHVAGVSDIILYLCCTTTYAYYIVIIHILYVFIFRTTISNGDYNIILTTK